MWNNGPAMIGMNGAFGFHGVLSLVLLAVVAVLVVALIHDRRRDRRQDAALTVLGTRYANGEIGRDEYLKLRKDLEA